MNLALYQVADKYLQELQQLNDTDLPPDQVDAILEAMQGDLQEKGSNVAMYARNLESAAAQIKQAEEAMAARRKALEKRAERMRDYLLTQMQRTGISKIESPFFTIAVRKNPPSMVIDAGAVIPPEYYRDPPPPPPPEKVLDKAALKEDLKAGVIIDGCRLESGFRLEIK